MGLFILDDKHLEHVPGTATLDELDEVAAAARHEHHSRRELKKSSNGTILVPQPSDDPNDPLNYPLWRRDLITFILCLSSVIASTLSPLLAANTLALLLYYNNPGTSFTTGSRPPQRTFTDVALLTGYHLLGVGIAGFIFVASARVWGKRHLYLLGTVIIIVSSVWAGASGRNYKSLLAARFFQGVGLAPFEALVNASVGDLYFVHERGKRMSVSNLAIYGGAFLTPVIVGKMTSTMGWQWTHYFVAIFAAAMLPLIVFLAPETAYTRDARLETDTLAVAASSHNTSKLTPTPSSPSGGEETSAEEKPSPNTTSTSHPGPTELLSLHALSPFNGRKTSTPFWKLLLRPFPLFLHPSIFWAMLIQGTLIGWTVLIGIVLAGIMIGPPLWFNEVQTGYMYGGAVIGAILGFVLAGLLSDSSARWLSKRNNGVFEPEFRLVLVIPQLILGCAGLYGFGITAQDTGRYGWFWPDFFFALVVAGMVLGAVASALYIVDAHRETAVEGFTCLLVFKNVFSFGLTFSGWEWLVSGDVKPVFVAIASVQVVICCSTLLLYILGKKNRSFFARYDILAMLKLK
ncbi:hypothetical protein Q7P37_002556 [Cladosporium fusiforme]